LTFDPISPFESRCSAIHDIRITGDDSAWLPCCQKLNALPTDVHIDYNRMINFSLLHHGSTFSKETAHVFSSYECFVQIICQPISGYEAGGPQHAPSDVQRLKIALALSPSTCPSVIKYRPTHLVSGQPCMIRQTRAFDLSGCSSSSPAASPSCLPPILLDEVDNNNPYHVVVREIAFGQNVGNDAPPPALFFNIPESEIKICSLKDELKFNTKKRKNKNKTRRFRAAAGGCRRGAAGSYPPSPLHGIFRLYCTNDEAIHSLIQSTMRLELDKLLMAQSCQTISSLAIFKSRELEIRTQIDALHAFFLESWWPVNEGREYVSSNTPVPPAVGFYSVPRHDKSHSRQWNSFVQNLGKKSSLYPSQTEQIQMKLLHVLANETAIATPASAASRAADDIIGAATSTANNSPRLRVFEDLTEKNEVLKWVENPECW
jgi:hypothetical protein